MKAARFSDALPAIRGEIRRAFAEHAYLLDEGHLRPEEADRFQDVLRQSGPLDLYTGSLRDLSQLLARHHGERVVILIDECDSPIHAAGRPEDEREVLSFFRELLSAGLKDNPHLFKGLLIGILRIAKESLFSGLNNLAVYHHCDKLRLWCFAPAASRRAVVLASTHPGDEPRTPRRYSRQKPYCATNVSQ